MKSINVHSGDETNFSSIVTTDAKFPQQRIVYPSTSSAILPGQSCVFTWQEKPENPNTIINAMFIKYRIENTAANTSTLYIPIWGLWGLIETMKLRINDVLIKQWDGRILNELFMSKLINYGSVKEFLNRITSTANILNSSTLADNRAIVGGTISPYYSSNLSELFDNFFRFRHVSFFNKVEIEFTLVNGSLPNSVLSKCIGIGTSGSSFNDLKVRDLQLVIDYSPFPNNTNLLSNSFKSELVLTYPYIKTYPVTANSTGTLIVNLNTDFVPVNSIQKIFLYFTNSNISGALTTANNYSVFVSSYISQIVLKRNGVQQFILQDSEIYNECIRWQRNHGIKPFDSYYTSTQFITNANTLFVNTSRDRSQFPLESASASIGKYTGISNALNVDGLWTLEISYDLTSAASYLDQLNVMLETSQLVCLYSDPRKQPVISY